MIDEVTIDENGREYHKRYDNYKISGKRTKGKTQIIVEFDDDYLKNVSEDIRGNIFTDEEWDREIKRYKKGEITTQEFYKLMENGEGWKRFCKRVDDLPDKKRIELHTQQVDDAISVWEVGDEECACLDFDDLDNIRWQFKEYADAQNRMDAMAKADLERWKKEQESKK